MKRLLFISPRCPTPPLLKGDQKRSNEFLQGLRATYDIDLVTFSDRALTEKDVEVLNSLSTKYWVFFRNKPGAFLHILTSFWKLRPFQHLYFESYKVQRLIDKLIKENDYDVVFCQLSRVADYVSKTKIKGLKVLDLQDRYSDNMLRRSANEVSKVKKAIFRLESQLLKRAESQLVKDFDRVIFVSERDTKGLEKYREKIKIIPVAVDMDRFRVMKRSVSSPLTLIIFGNMGYFPNYDGAIWFIQEVLPALRGRHPGLVLYVVGPNPPERLKSLQQEGVVITGFVNDLQPYLDKSHIAVVPLRAGSGMQNKILEAIAAGLPVVCSEHAIKGSSDLADYVTVIPVSVNQFAEGVESLVSKYDQNLDIVIRGRAYLNDSYSDTAVLNKLLDAIN